MSRGKATYGYDGSKVVQPRPRYADKTEEFRYLKSKSAAPSFEFEDVDGELLFRLVASCIRNELGLYFASIYNGRAIRIKVFGGAVPLAAEADTANEFADVVNQILNVINGKEVENEPDTKRLYPKPPGGN